jgi:putative ABC transport system permease protein
LNAPRWTRAFLAFLAPEDRVDDVLGDLEEAHRSRVRRHGRFVATILTSFEALDMGVALLLERARVQRRPRTLEGRALTVAKSRRPRGVGVSLLDFKLGLRMLVRYPGLTVVAGLAMAFALAVGAGTFEFLKDAMYPTLPLDEGDRVIRLQILDARTGGPAAIAPADFAAWREGVVSLEALGAFHAVARNLRFGEEAVVPVNGAATSAAAFEVARQPPLLGRPLLKEDETPAAPPVVVLGYELWRSRFASDPDAVGRVVRLGETPTTVVGVMPRDFAFPVPMDFYVPIHLDNLIARAREGTKVPGVLGFGRLAPGVTLEEAAAELEALGAGTFSDTVEEQQHATPVVRPFAYPVLTAVGIATNTVFALMALFLALLMVVVCFNVALLMYARAAARQGELAIRAALGASRPRIVVQLFVEALVLAGVAAAVGLWGASIGLKWALRLMNAGQDWALPFWVGDTLSPSTVGWAVLLTVFGAAIAGVIPGIQITGRGMAPRIQPGTGEGYAARIGRLWTSVVISQVALTVAIMPAVLLIASYYWMVRSSKTEVATEQYLVARLEANGDAGAFEGSLAELRERLRAEPAVRGITLADQRWGLWRENWQIEVEDMEPHQGQDRDRRSLHMSVDPNYFDVMGARLMSGRLLTAEDVAAERRVVVVNEWFVQHVLDGRNAVGRRIHFERPHTVSGSASADEQAKVWYEIVGVMSNLGLNPHADLPHRGVVYRPLQTEGATRLFLTVHVAGEPQAFARRLQVLALQVDPTLLGQSSPQRLDSMRDQSIVEYRAFFLVIGSGGAIALLLTLSGIYAVMSFTVARRTREIGVRVALGAGHRQVAVAILSRTATNVGYGVLAGGGLIMMFLLLAARTVEPAPAWPPPLAAAALMFSYLGAMMAVSMLACVVPARRALSVEPTEALRAEG